MRNCIGFDIFLDTSSKSKFCIFYNQFLAPFLMDVLTSDLYFHAVGSIMAKNLLMQHLVTKQKEAATMVICDMVICYKLVKQNLSSHLIIVVPEGVWYWYSCMFLDTYTCLWLAFDGWNCVSWQVICANDNCFAFRPGNKEIFIIKCKVKRSPDLLFEISFIFLVVHLAVYFYIDYLLY